MQTALKLTATVQAGGRVEGSIAQLTPGEAVEITDLYPRVLDRRSMMEVLAEAPGHLAFQTAEEVDAYIREERQAWER